MKIDGHKVPERHFEIGDRVTAKGAKQPMVVVGYYLWRGRRWHYYVTEHIHDHATVRLAKDITRVEDKQAYAPRLSDNPAT